MVVLGYINGDGDLFANEGRSRNKYDYICNHMCIYYNANSDIAKTPCIFICTVERGRYLLEKRMGKNVCIFSMGGCGTGRVCTRGQFNNDKRHG